MMLFQVTALAKVLFRPKMASKAVMASKAIHFVQHKFVFWH